MSSTMVLNGSLEFLSLGDVLQLLGANGSTGVLRLKSKYAPEPGEIFIIEGNPVNANNGNASGLEALQGLFGWTTGRFEFEQGDVRCEKVIKQSRMNIILDALSMLDEGAIETLGPVSYTKKPDKTADDAPVVPVIRGPIIDYMYVVQEESYGAGQEIAAEGKHGNWIWVILEGVVELSKKSDAGEVKLLKVSDGAFLGSMAAFQIDGNVRSATAVASDDVVLGVLDTQRLAEEYSRFSTNFRLLVNGLDRRLRAVSENAAKMRFGQASAEQLTTDADPVIPQGGTEKQLYAVTQGYAYVIRKTRRGNILLATLKTGDFFGHVPFLDFGHEPESASVFGSGAMKADTLEVSALQREYDALSTTFKNMIDHIVTSISVTTHLTEDFYKRISADPKG